MSNVQKLLARNTEILYEWLTNNRPFDRQYEAMKTVAEVSGDTLVSIDLYYENWGLSRRCYLERLASSDEKSLSQKAYTGSRDLNFRPGE